MAGNKGTYRFKTHKPKSYTMETTMQITHLIDEGVEEDINRLFIEAITKTRND